MGDESMKWLSIPCSKVELCLETVLMGGQCFRWRERNTDPKQWIGVVGGNVWTLKQSSDTLSYQIHSPPPRPDPVADLLTPPHAQTEDHEAAIRDYFQLNVNLSQLYNKWSENDCHFKQTAPSFPGVRILRQEPVENLFSFICSQNNHISRISAMVNKLCTQYGDPLLTIDGEMLHSFPTVQTLAQGHVEAELRGLGFGYRARYVSQCAKIISEKDETNWLCSLRSLPYEEAKKQLLALPGVGPKVADCICLMSLDKFESIPVDTHVWQIATKNYLPHLKSAKSLTDKIYREVGDFFRERFGDYAGWAHSVLFCADLRQFKDKKASSEQPRKEKKAEKRKVVLKTADRSKYKRRK